MSLPHWADVGPDCRKIRQIAGQACKLWTNGTNEAEALAGVQAQKGSLWHAYRRKWATERKHLPDVDVAAAGGWITVQTLKTAYHQADPDTMLRVGLEGGELREAR
jgi:hypothetical protein